MNDAKPPAPPHELCWGARAGEWAEHAAGISRPAWEAVADATGIGRGTRVLDIGCGTGEFCELALARGARAAGVDVAAEMIELARRLAPGADLRVGAMERLPWPDDRFDVVVAFNALQFAADALVALGEAGRVARPGGQVAVCSWGRAQESELLAVMGALRELRPPPRSGRPGVAAVAGPGPLEDLARRAALTPVRAGEIEVPYEPPDLATLERAVLASPAAAAAIEHAGEEAVRRAIVERAAPFRRADGSYRFENRFRYLIAGA